MPDTPILETRGITVRFGGHVAVNDVSITVERGAITGLIGPNGAGKTTLFNTITGLQKPASGKIVLDGQDVTRLSPAKRANKGLARTFQRLELFLSLSVRDNIRVAGDIHKANTRSRIDVDAETDRILELTKLTDVADKDV
ncbi:MAG: ATP-binding cassette domain-containing protein, partial [Nocardiaceae bacterium]|nr:ATP-binding cassette domain-containing protein [Nocardiaceae bacterium]